MIFIFCRFGLKLLIHAHFLGVLGEYFSIVLTPNRIFARIYVVWAIKCENRSHLGRGRRIEKKGKKDKTVKKQVVVIFRLFGGSPTVPIETRICMAENLAYVITCAKFQDKNFHWLQFYRGRSRISHFPIDLCMR